MPLDSNAVMDLYSFWLWQEILVTNFLVMVTVRNDMKFRNAIVVLEVSKVKVSFGSGEIRSPCC